MGGLGYFRVWGFRGYSVSGLGVYSGFGLRFEDLGGESPKHYGFTSLDDRLKVSKAAVRSLEGLATVCNDSGT